MIKEGARLLELHSSVFVVSGMSYNEWNQTAVSYSNQFLTRSEDTSLDILSGNVFCMS